VHIKTGSTLSLRNLKYLPSYADYLLKNHLREYAEQTIHFCQELNLPLLKAIEGMGHENMVLLSMESSKEFLTYLAQNRAEEQIETALIKWIKNQLPVIDQKDIGSEDITLLTYIRKKTFLYFITSYSKNVNTIISLVQEIDLFLTRYETESTNTYIDLLRTRIREQSYLNEKITNTSPGLIYLFDLSTYSFIYINQSGEEFFGLSQNELIKLGNKGMEKLVHPEDLPKTIELLKEISASKEDDTWAFEYRLKNYHGEYIWMNNTISIFKRDNNNMPLEIIGNMINIQKEIKINEQLKLRETDLRKSEELYKQAQALSHIGHYSLNLETKEIYLTDEIKRICELDADKSVFHYSEMISLRHPDDAEMVEKIMKNAFENQEPFDFDFRIITKNAKLKTVHAIGEIMAGDEKTPRQMVGTFQDVTERYEILEQLRKSDARHKQAEALTHIGSYVWDLDTLELEWSDEMFRIYGMEPTPDRKLNSESIRRFNHPEDAEPVINAIATSIKEKQPHDLYYRIKLDDGIIKILHARGEVVFENDRPSKLIGTAQDVTEKQTLIRRLRQSESMYKQAEELANMGNWRWDIANKKLEWTDQLYKIYGLEPQSEEITIERFLNFVHPQDRPPIEESVRKGFPEDFIDFTFRIITDSGKEKTIRSIAQLQRNKRGQIINVIGTEQDITERQLLISRLQESEKLYKQAQALARIGNWSMDLKTNIFTWSDEMYHIYEMEEEKEFNLEEWAGYMHPEDKEEVLQHLQECLRNKTPYDKHHRIVIPKSGKVKMLHRKGEFIYDEKGEAIKLIGTTQDVTEPFRIQQELKENQTFIRKIADATPSIIASYNINTGQYTFISEGLQKLLGYDPKEVKEKGAAFFAGIIHPDDLEPIMAKNLKALNEANRPENREQSDIVEFVYRMRHADGAYLWFHTYGTVFDRNSNGEVEHVLNISLDVTDQYEAIRTIEEQEHFIEHIADASPTVLYVYDIASDSIAYVNREIFFVLGYTREEILAMGSDVTQNLYHPEDIHLLPERKLSNKKIAESDIMLQYECRMHNKEGEWQWFLVREVVFKTDEKGNVLQIVGAALDISRRKEMEKTLLQNSFQLEQSNASLEEFAYVASHDLKEPLRKISTFGDRLVASQVNNLTQEGKVYLSKIVDASQRMQTMINDLLSISMISGNKSFEPYSLQKILEETLQTLEYKIEQKNAIIKADPLPEANIIPSQFRQLFQNLLSNSLKFVRDDVQPIITITCAYLKQHEVAHYQLAAAEKFLKIEFSDNGIGFENEFAGRIFAIFQRLHGRSEYEGSGIGLAICKKIVEHHGGVIYAAGVPDQGASFTIILPA
jgi:PAS domain S-box-containing protein